ncbi:7100_t:CDS:2 [Paraglomus occultum]|uniref:7100_t:CDS:1 n=1 Tax=Paraglomus occultum TaxID=144539 RepID=A0A9N8ZME0_9GLOM|nr:7100_t:CDS:2 [Paraglomus occultum]
MAESESQITCPIFLEEEDVKIVDVLSENTKRNKRKKKKSTATNTVITQQTQEFRETIASPVDINDNVIPSRNGEPIQSSAESSLTAQASLGYAKLSPEGKPSTTPVTHEQYIDTDFSNVIDYIKPLFKAICNQTECLSKACPQVRRARDELISHEVFPDSASIARTLLTLARTVSVCTKAIDTLITTNTVQNNICEFGNNSNMHTKAPIVTQNQESSSNHSDTTRCGKFDIAYEKNTEVQSTDDAINDDIHVSRETTDACIESCSRNAEENNII